MESLLGQILVAMGAVIAALIAGAFAFFSLVVTKETKVSEFRQAWIDSLRAEISTYISRLHAVNNLGQYIHEKPVEDKYNPDLLRERSRMFEESLSAYNSILLRINPAETKAKARVLNQNFLEALRKAQNYYEAGHVELLDDNLKAVGLAAAPLLKYEWDRVRGGEPAYINAKTLALTIALTGGVSALVLLAAAIFYVPTAASSAPEGKVPASNASMPNNQGASQTAPSAPTPSIAKPLASGVK